MRLRTKLNIALFTTALLPVLVTAIVAYLHSSRQAERLNADLTVAQAKATAGQLATFFAARIGEMESYACIPTVRRWQSEEVATFSSTKECGNRTSMKSLSSVTLIVAFTTRRAVTRTRICYAPMTIQAQKLFQNRYLSAITVKGRLAIIRVMSSGLLSATQ